jgi:hypothetical protein
MEIQPKSGNVNQTVRLQFIMEVTRLQMPKSKKPAAKSIAS